MIVMCVANLKIGYLPSWAVGMQVPLPEIGSEYEVTNTLVKDDGLTYYELVGFVKQEIDARAFAIMPPFTMSEKDDQERESIIR